MKKFFIVTALVLTNHSISFARIIRVGFFGTPLANVDYSTFANAYTAANAGDTILMFPSTQVSGTFTKKLTVIGPGNLLDPTTTTPKGNANEEANPGEATISSVVLSAGSDGTVIMGFHTGTIYVAANNCIIRRNRDILVYISYNPAGNIVLNTTGTQIMENYELAITHNFANGSAITNLTISNNFINYLTLSTLNTYSGNISNNVWAFDNTLISPTNGGSNTLSYSSSGIGFGNGVFLFQNNIVISYTSPSSSNFDYLEFADAGNTVFNNNLISQSTNASGITSNGSGNVIVAATNIPAVFAAFPTIGSISADARYQLGASSAALTVGAGGTPIGMFAGSTPYKLSTIPTIPSVYSLSSPQGNNPSGSTIQINVSTRGNN